MRLLNYMSLSTWKQFQFYESIPIKDPSLGSESPLFADPTLSATALIKNESLAIAVRSVVIKVINLADSVVQHEFTAFEEGFQITYLKATEDRFLIAVGELVGRPSQIKIYKLDKLPTNPKTYHAMVELKNGSNTFPISVVTLTSDLSCIVVGYVNGKIILVRGDLSRDRGSRQRVIYSDAGKEPITSLFLNRDASCCIAATTSRIMLFETSGRNRGLPDVILNSSSGVDLNCGYLSPFTGEFICITEGAIEYYRENGERYTLPLEIKSPKRIFPIDQNHVMLIAGEEKSNTTALEINELSSPQINRIIILDTKNKVVVLNFIIPYSIIDVLHSPANHNSPLFLLTSNGVMYSIVEKTRYNQIQIVLQKEMFPFALELANQYKINEINIQEIHKKYGDSLYKKGFIKEATQQYIQCLDVVETSEIISKFGVESITDPSEIRNLSDYIWSLIKSGKSNHDHVTLLLIVLIKLKDLRGLDDFIQHFSREGVYTKDSIANDIDDEVYFYADKKLFDLELITDLLKESGYVMEAYRIVKKFSKDPLVVVEILLDYISNPVSALAYIKSLPIDDILRVLVTYSKSLLEKIPNETNILLIEVFTGNYTPIEFSPKIERVKLHEQQPDLKKIFYSYRTFFEYMNQAIGPNGSNVSAINISDVPTYHPPKPSLIFSAFIKRPFQFVVFLEACLESYKRYDGFKEDMQVILTTLYDLYLTLAMEDEVERQEGWRKKAQNVLNESSKLIEANTSNSSTKSLDVEKSLDPSLMMLISHMNNVNGSYCIGDKKIYHDIPLDNPGDLNNVVDSFRSLALTSDTRSCMTYFEKYKETDRTLYKVALKYFISSPDIYKEFGGDSALKDNFLDVIISKKLMSMLDLISLLSTSSVVTFGLIQDMLLKQAKETEEDLVKSELLIESYEKELLAKKEKLKSIISRDVPVQIRVKNRNCFQCKTSLELPLVYFKCGHSYHQRCLNEEDYTEDGQPLFKCPKCIVDLETSARLYEAQKDVSQRYDLLKNVLDNGDDCDDKFKEIINFVGRGGLEYTHVTI